MTALRRIVLLLVCMLMIVGLTTTASAARPTIIDCSSGTIYASAGETVTLFVEADSNGKSFVWQAINDYTLPENESRRTSTYTFTMTPELDGAYVHCLVSFDRWYYRYSDGVWLELPPINFTEHPQDVEVIAGDTVTASIAAAGDRLTYQWYWKNVHEDEYTIAPCTGPNFSAIMNEPGNYLIRCTATDASGQTKDSLAGYIEVFAPVYITSDIKSMELKLGQTYTYWFLVEGLEVEMQWFEKDAGNSSFTPVPDIDAYKVTMDHSVDGRKIYCVATDRNGNTVTSSVATLTLDSSIESRGNCTTCDGDGNCNRCSGTGMYYKTVMVDGKHKTIHTDCDGANCYGGDCSACGGSGWIGTETLAGDADGNGTVNTRDALLVMQYAAGWDVAIVDFSADVNANKVIETYDAVLILQSIAGN